MNESLEVSQTSPIVIEGWPLVRVTFRGPANEADVQGWLEAMNALFERQAPFGLLTKTLAESDFSELGRRAMGLWFKESREAIGQWCVGVARIALDEAAVERLAGPKMQAAMPCPIMASVQESEAVDWLQSHLMAAGE